MTKAMYVARVCLASHSNRYHIDRYDENRFGFTLQQVPETVHIIEQIMQLITNLMKL